MGWECVLLRQSWGRVVKNAFFYVRAKGRDGKMVFEGANETSESSYGC